MHNLHFNHITFLYACLQVNRMKNLSRIFQKQKRKAHEGLSFITQFKIEILLLFTGFRKVLRKFLAHFIAQLMTRLAYSRADWDGLLNFVSGFNLELMYISLIENIRSSLIHLHGFQLIVQLLQFIEITFFVYTKRINLLILK